MEAVILKSIQFLKLKTQNHPHFKLIIGNTEIRPFDTSQIIAFSSIKIFPVLKTVKIAFY